MKNAEYYKDKYQMAMGYERNNNEYLKTGTK